MQSSTEQQTSNISPPVYHDVPIMIFCVFLVLSSGTVRKDMLTFRSDPKGCIAQFQNNRRKKINGQHTFMWKKASKLLCPYVNSVHLDLHSYAFM